MKCFLYLVFLSIFLLSCNKAVYFFNEDEEPDQLLILDRDVWDIRKKRGRKSRKRNRQSTYEYHQPPEEEFIVLDAQVEFIQLASSDITHINLQRETQTGVPVTIDTKEDQNPTVLSKPLKIEPVSPLNISTSVPSSHQPVKIDISSSQLKRKREVEVQTPLPVVQMDAVQNLLLPELVSGWTVRAPVKTFIPRPLDFFVVMDTSASMHHHLIIFKEKFFDFLRYFFGWNWKLAMTDANHGDNMFFLSNIGALKGKAMNLERDGTILDLRYLHPGILGYNQIFLDSISKHRPGEYTKHGGRDGFEDVDPCDLPPYCQGDQEQPLRSLKSALSKNPDFFREEADLVAIVVSNSKERASDPGSATQPEEVIEEFERIHGTQKRFTVYGIIINENDPGCLNQNIIQQFFFPEGAISEKIAILSERTGGKTFSICSSDYQELAQHILDSFSKPKEK